MDLSSGASSLTRKTPCNRVALIKFIDGNVLKTISNFGSNAFCHPVLNSFNKLVITGVFNAFSFSFCYFFFYKR
jgi:hypothetical protein